MRVLVSGATGLVGTPLVTALRGRGDEVVVLTRRPESVDGPSIGWDPAAARLDEGAVEGFDAVVHLAGESIASGRWTDAQKKRIRESRVAGTTLLAQALAKAEKKPQVLVSASAIGFYGHRADQRLDESANPGSGFLSEVCVAWESAAEPARQAGLRVVHPRIGVVLHPEGGALKKMLPPFKLGLGGRVGSGEQYMSWVALDDVVGIILHAIDHPEVRGPINATAPEPVTNAQFTQCLGEALSRPTVIPVPGFALKMALGEMADELLLASTRAVPEVAVRAGYEFRRPELLPYLRSIL